MEIRAVEPERTGSRGAVAVAGAKPICDQLAAEVVHGLA
jgi:hypothetical protein